MFNYLCNKINVLKKFGSGNKGIAFMDFNSKEKFNYVLNLTKSQKYSIENSILLFEAKL